VNDIQHLGSIDGAQIAIQLAGLKQNILIQRTPAGQHLVRFLGAEPNGLPTVQVGGASYWPVEHNAEVDTLLKQAIDVLISIRYLHPTFVQMQMQLG
jgi:hypothetical protein